MTPKDTPGILSLTATPHKASRVAPASSLRPLRSAVALTFALLSSVTHSTQAQGVFNPLSFLQTDGNTALHTDSIHFQVPQNTGSPASMAFQFGFETDEETGPGQFFDSFSITLQDANSLVTIILLTVDASGVVFLPPSVAGDPLDSTTVQGTPITPPGLDPSLSFKSAFSVQALIPDALIGKDAKLYLDLFDNGDSVRSQAWFGSLTVVPESSGLALLGLSGILFSLRTRHRPR